MNNFTLICTTVVAALWVTQAVAAGDAGTSLTGSLNKPAKVPAARAGIAGTSPAGSLNNPAQQPAAGAAGRSMTSDTVPSATVRDNVVAQLAGAVGYRVYVQAWNPLKPDLDTPAQVANQPAGISKAMNGLWDAARTFITDPKTPDSVPSLLGKKDLIAKGVNLYNIKFTVNPLSTIDLQQGGSGVVYAGQAGSGPRPQAPRPNAITVHWKISGTRLEFKATTPDVVKGLGASRLVDPDLSAQIDLDIPLGLAVSDTPGQPYLQVTEVQVFAQQAKIDSGNLSGDVLVGLTNFLSNTLYGKSFNALLDQIFNDRNLAADPQHGGFAFGRVKTFDMQAMANEYLKPVNDAIAGSGVTNYVRSGVWVKPQANGRVLALLFAPRNLPLPPLKGGMIGTVRFDTTISANKLPASCDGLVSGAAIDVEVQTGPRKVLDVDPFSYGAAPMQRLANVVFSGQPLSNHQCTYVLSGLALGYPNNIAFPPPALRPNGSAGQVAQFIKFEPQNWSSPVLPPPAAGSSGGIPLVANGNAAPLANYNLVATMSFAADTGVGAAQVNPAGLANGRTNPGGPVEKWGTQNATNEQTAVQHAGQPAPSALATQGTHPASAGPKWGAPGNAAGTAPVSAATTRSASQGALRAGQPAATPSSLGTSEQRQ